MTVAADKSQLRKTLRAQRRKLTRSQQASASVALIPVLRTLLSSQKVRRIALYTAMDGEIDLDLFTQYCWQRGIEIYLPVLHRFKPTLWFARYEANSKLFKNRFGIDEPLQGSPLRAWQLDLVLLPLVGFDEQGGRLGMGGGFYDRTFARAKQWPKQPKLFGVAHECQKVDSIPLEVWDIKLNGIVTDRRVYKA